MYVEGQQKKPNEGGSGGSRREPRQLGVPPVGVFSISPRRGSRGALKATGTSVGGRGQLGYGPGGVVEGWAGGVVGIDKRRKGGYGGVGIRPAPRGGSGFLGQRFLRGTGGVGGGSLLD